jgi:stage IV sporulation protein A
MKDNKIIESISKRGNGEIYLGVVGAVRTGKSTFIKKFIENLIVPYIEDEYERKHCLDEIPQSAQGKTIMTTEPKFVPSNGATLKIDNFTTNMKLIDCVGYVVKGAKGYEDENGNPRMVKTPWFDTEIPFTEAAEIGTEKVIKDHATIGIVVTTDGSFGELKREEYIEVEEKVITELKTINKPFIVILNTSHPESDNAKNIVEELHNKHNVPVLPISVETMSQVEIYEILRSALYEFPVTDITISIPEWVHILPNEHKIKKEYLEKIKASTFNINKLRDVDSIIEYFKDSEYISKSYISNVDTSTGIVTIHLDSEDSLYEETLNSYIGSNINSKAAMLKIFSELSYNKEETESIKAAIKTAKQTGYGIVYPSLKDMELSTPEIIKQGSRYGIKIKAIAPAVCLTGLNIESTFEPIIGSEAQAEALINHMLEKSENNIEELWNSEIFGRKLCDVINDGIYAKINNISDDTLVKFKEALEKVVNQARGGLIAVII